MCFRAAKVKIISYIIDCTATIPRFPFLTTPEYTHSMHK